MHKLNWKGQLIFIALILFAGFCVGKFFCKPILHAHFDGEILEKKLYFGEDEKQ